MVFFGRNVSAAYLGLGRKQKLLSLRAGLASVRGAKTRENSAVSKTAGTIFLLYRKVNSFGPSFSNSCSGPYLGQISLEFVMKRSVPINAAPPARTIGTTESRPLF
jgi:hypothetical protein